MVEFAAADYGVQGVLARTGSNLHYWLKEGPTGDAPVVMLIHGAGVDHRMWAPQIGPFSQTYRVLTLDVRGHGLSRPFGAFSFDAIIEDAFAVLDALRIDQVILVGLSMGGNIAQEMVFRAPGRVRALICLDCTCNTLVPWIDRMTVPFLTSIFDAMLALYPMKSLAKEIGRSSALTPEGQAYAEATVLATTKKDLGRTMKMLLAALHHEPSYKVPLPELLIQGAHDRLGNIAKVMPKWRTRDAQSSLVIVPNASHCANIDNPSFVNDAVLSWLARTLR